MNQCLFFCMWGHFSEKRTVSEANLSQRTSKGALLKRDIAGRTSWPPPTDCCDSRRSHSARKNVCSRWKPGMKSWVHDFTLLSRPIWQKIQIKANKIATKPTLKALLNNTKEKTFQVFLGSKVIFPLLTLNYSNMHSGETVLPAIT